MKKNKNHLARSQRLALHRETMRRLDARELQGARGGNSFRAAESCSGDTNGTSVGESSDCKPRGY